MKIEDVEYVWEAYAAKGEPLCIAGVTTGKHPEGISVSLYFSRRGRLKGVVILDGDKDEVVTYGQVPAEATA